VKEGDAGVPVEVSCPDGFEGEDRPLKEVEGGGGEFAV